MLNEKAVQAVNTARQNGMTTKLDNRGTAGHLFASGQHHMIWALSKISPDLIFLPSHLVWVLIYFKCYKRNAYIKINIAILEEEWRWLLVQP